MNSLGLSIHMVLRAKVDKDLANLEGLAALGLAQLITLPINSAQQGMREELDEMGEAWRERLAIAFIENWRLANEKRPDLIDSMVRFMPQAYDFICQGLDADAIMISTIPAGGDISWLPQALMVRTEARELRT